jgi:hypothetical protein
MKKNILPGSATLCAGSGDFTVVLVVFVEAWGFPVDFRVVLGVPDVVSGLDFWDAEHRMQLCR